jgi:hypothetical protein
VKSRSLIAIVTLLLCWTGVSPAQTSRAAVLNETHQVQFAKRVAMIELVQALSPSVRLERQKCAMGCEDGGALELAVGLIGIAKGQAGADALTDLLALRLDGAGSSELHCQILTRGPQITAQLKRVSAANVVEHCKASYHEIRKREVANVSDVRFEQVCRTVPEVSIVRNELLKAIGSKAQCER